MVNVAPFATLRYPCTMCGLAAVVHTESARMLDTCTVVFTRTVGSTDVTGVPPMVAPTVTAEPAFAPVKMAR